MEKFNQIKEQAIKFVLRYKTYVFAAVLVASIFLGVLLYKETNYQFITAQFKEYRPSKKKLPVYYNGIEVGKVGKVGYSDDYRYTMVKIVLLKPKIKFPKNVTAQLKKDKKLNHEVDYIELMYPETPLKEDLKSGDVIEGKSTIDLANYMANQDPGVLEQIRNNTNKTMESAQATLDALTQLFGVIQEIAEENRPNFLIITKNLAGTTTNMNQISDKLNKSLTQQSLNSIVSNADSALVNVQDVTQQVQIIAESVNSTTDSLSQTMPKVDAVVVQVDNIVKNIEEITCGVNKTLRKRLGGARLFFGQAIDDECNSGSGCK